MLLLLDTCEHLLDATANLLTKLGATNRREAVALAARHGLV
jgi:predicted ATPase